MKVREIIDKGNLLGDVDYDDLTWIGWINESQSDLAEIAGPEFISIINVIAGQASYPLPDNTIEILTVLSSRGELTRLPINDTKHVGYKIFANAISLQPTPAQPDTLTIYGIRGFTPIANTNETPELDPQFHHLFILYGCARAQQVEEELTDKVDFYNDYLAGKLALQRRMERMRGFNRSKYVLDVDDLETF